MQNLKPRYILPERLEWPGSLIGVMLVLVFGVAYYLLGVAGLAIETGYPGVTPFWPASGLALLVFLFFGPGYWPVIFVGIGLLAYQLEMPLAVAFLAACGHMLEAMTGWYLIGRSRLSLSFRRVREVLQFALIAFVASLVSSLVGGLAMIVGDMAEWSGFGLLWSMWWLGDAIGILLVVPFVLIWRNFVFYCKSGGDHTRLDSDITDDCHYILRSRRIGQLAVYVLLLGVAALYSFSDVDIELTGRLGLFYLILPVTVFIAISFEQFGASLASVLVSIILLYSYSPGAEPFSSSGGIVELLIVVMFICITSITALVVAALFTERRQSEKELRISNKRLQESELRLRQLSENINEVFWLVDAADGQPIYLSPSCRDIWGRDPEEFYNAETLWIDSIHPDDRQRVSNAFEEFRKAGKFEIQYRIIRSDGTVRWINDKGFPVYDETGKIYRLAGVAEDITEKREAEEHKLQQEEDRARLSRYISVGELGTSLAHEINQPLTSIMCYAKGGLNRAREGRLSDTDVQEVFGRLSHEAERAGKIINKLRDFVNRKDIKFSSVDINELVQDSLRLVENKLETANVQVVYVLGKSMPLTLVDSVLTQQVILNLVINAIESMEEIEAERVLTVMTQRDGEYVRVSFRDTGPGVPEELRDQLFVPLFTTKKQGIGLGLSIANSIIESMGGELTAHPAMGRGYVFEFSLPINQRHDRSDHALSNRQ